MRLSKSAACLEPLELRRLLSAYFIDASSGSDANAGRSPSTAWQTLGAVADHHFRPGDRIYLTGTFVNQTLSLGPRAAGVSVNTYVTVGVQKTAQIGVPNAAVLVGEQADGIDITTSNITIQNLTITADPSVIANGNYAYGIYLHNATSRQLVHETINNVNVSGFSYSGLCLQGWNGTATASRGFSNVLIENSSFHDNQVSGLFAAAGDSTGNEFQPAFPANLYVNYNLTIRNCLAYNNAGFNAALTGTPDGININQGNSTAGGLFISSVAGATVQHCTTYNNCFACQGGVGTWAFDATHVVFQHDESYDNKTLGPDGDGFDFDHGTTHSLMQYDYSHGNAGWGFLIATVGGSSNDIGNTLRYNVADDNNGGILIGTLQDVPALDENIYNNTVLTGGAPGQTSVAIAIIGDASECTINILDNIFNSAESGPILLLSNEATAVRFERNDYWTTDDPGDFSASVNGVIYASLADWIAASPGEETFRGKTIGLVTDPMLVNETVSDLPIGSVDDLMLSAQSPLRLEAQIPGAWSRVGLGHLNLFDRPTNLRAIGAG